MKVTVVNPERLDWLRQKWTEICLELLDDKDSKRENYETGKNNDLKVG